MDVFGKPFRWCFGVCALAGVVFVPLVFADARRAFAGYMIGLLLTVFRFRQIRQMLAKILDPEAVSGGGFRFLLPYSLGMLLMVTVLAFSAWKQQMLFFGMVVSLLVLPVSLVLSGIWSGVRGIRGRGNPM